MKYLVTGGAGFIGSNIVDELVRRGHSVTVLDDLSAGKESNLAGVRDKIDFRLGSITDLPVIQKACEGADYVVHLAARTSVPRSVKDPIESNRVNIDGTLNVLVAARDAKVKRIVYAASSSAYGETPVLPKVETMQPMPISPYGVTKFVGELYAQVFGRVYGLENVCVRYFNVFGPRQDPTSQYSGVLSKFMLAALKGESPVIYGDGEQTRDLVVWIRLRLPPAVPAGHQHPANPIPSHCQIQIAFLANTRIDRTTGTATVPSRSARQAPASCTSYCSCCSASLQIRPRSSSSQIATCSTPSARSNCHQNNCSSTTNSRFHSFLAAIGYSHRIRIPAPSNCAAIPVFPASGWTIL